MPAVALPGADDQFGETGGFAQAIVRADQQDLGRAGVGGGGPGPHLGEQPIAAHETLPFLLEVGAELPGRGPQLQETRAGAGGARGQGAGGLRRARSLRERSTNVAR